MGDSWIRIQKVRTLGEATLLRDALENEGIRADIRGEHRPSIAGELPLPEAEVEVWVLEADTSRALAMLERANQAADSDPRHCPKCGEENPGSFELCWKCQSDLAESGNAGARPDPSVSTSGPAQDTVKPGVSWKSVCFLLLFGSTIAGAGGYFFGRRSAFSESGSPLTTSRWDASGECHEERLRAGQRLIARQCDGNQNGIFERTAQYARAGWILSEAFDENESGIYERIITYGPSGKLSEAIDRDEDGVFDSQVVFGRGGRRHSEYFDHDGDGYPEKLIEHRALGTKSVWFDKDGDGLFDQRQVHKDGKIVRTGEDRGEEGFVAIPAAQQ
jgi:hypothetical protein